MIIKDALRKTSKFYENIKGDILWGAITFIALFFATYLDILKIGGFLGKSYEPLLPFIYIPIVLLVSAPILFTGNLIEIFISRKNSFGIIIQPLPKFEEQVERVGLLINNTAEKDITDFYVEVKRLTIEDISDIPIGEERQFFSCVNRIPAKQQTKVYIAEAGKDHTIFLTNSNYANRIYFLKMNDGHFLAVYEIIIEIGGKVGDNLIHPQVYRGQIVHWYKENYETLIKPKRKEILTHIDSYMYWNNLEMHSMNKEHKRQREKKHPERIRFSDAFTREDFLNALNKIAKTDKKKLPTKTKRKLSK